MFVKCVATLYCEGAASPMKKREQKNVDGLEIFEVCAFF